MGGPIRLRAVVDRRWAGMANDGEHAGRDDDTTRGSPL